jgi:hypothetical protein
MKLRFTIRDLLWLIVVVALAVGWWLDHRQAAEENYRLKILNRGSARRLAPQS